MRIGWFSTGRDQEACNLLAAVLEQTGRLDCTISYVFCNRAPGESEASDKFHSLVLKSGLPLITLSSAGFLPGLRRQGRQDSECLHQWRRSFDQHITDLIRPYPAEVIILAGYMLIMGDDLCRRYDLLNLHPALPGGPAGSWQEVIWQLILKEADTAGAMMHLVTPELDSGPAATYFSFPIRGPGWDYLWQEWSRRKSKVLPYLQDGGMRKNPGPEEELFWKVRREEARREIPLLLMTLDYLAQGEFRLAGGRVLDRQGVILERGYCLNQAVEDFIAAT